MKNRLEVARDLLKEEGVIFVQCDDNEQAYLKVLMDEIFGRSNFLNQISVKMKQTSGASGGGEDKKLKKNIEYIIIYTKNMDGDSGFKKFNEVYDEEDLFTVIKQMRDEGKSWKYTRVIKSLGTRKLLKTIYDGSGQPIDLYTHENVVIEPISKISKEENISEEECYLKYFDFIFRDTNAQSSIRTRVMDAINSEYDLIVKEPNLYTQILNVADSIQDIKKLASDDPLRQLFKNYDVSKSKDIYGNDIH